MRLETKTQNTGCKAFVSHAQTRQPTLDRVMGVAGLPARLKEVASKRVALDACDSEARGRHVVVDGHYAPHRAGGTADVAVPLVLDNDVVTLAMTLANRLNMLATAGWAITVVFDGRTPPGKANTACGRASEREEARRRCVELDKDENVKRDNNELRKTAVRAVHFSSSIVARVSRILVHVLGCTCVRAPYESDAQLAVLEAMYLKMGKQVLVHGTDSYLTVLGERSLLWEFADEDGSLYGQVITQQAITCPQFHALKGEGDGSQLLRLLHGMTEGREGDVFVEGNAELVMHRLRIWSSVAGNDYSKFEGIGPKKAIDICLRSSVGVLPTLDELAGEISRVGRFSVVEVEAALRRSETMTLHPVVYCLETGQQRHLSACDSTEEITRETGML